MVACKREKKSTICGTKPWHAKVSPKSQMLAIEGFLSGREHVEAPPQMNPFAKAQREGKVEKQTEMI